MSLPSLPLPSTQPFQPTEVRTSAGATGPLASAVSTHPATQVGDPGAPKSSLSLVLEELRRQQERNERRAIIGFVMVVVAIGLVVLAVFLSLFVTVDPSKRPPLRRKGFWEPNALENRSSENWEFPTGLNHYLA